MPSKRTILTSCPVCGDDVLSAPDYLRAYCSTPCRGIADRGKPKPKHNLRPAALRFWTKVNTTGDSWLWTGCLARNGYGKFGRTHGDTVYAHQFAWYLATDHWPTRDERVCHTCDIPSCVRNDEVGVYEVAGITYERRGHLWLGTNKANGQDMIAKGRGVTADRHWSTHHPERVMRGDIHTNSKLSADQVRIIRTDAATGITYQQLADIYRVSEVAIRRVVSRESWAHVE
jgi:hypothetical protein